MSHKLWVFHGGAAPRRVTIYLAERGFPSSFIAIIPTTISHPGAPAIAPGKPPGTVPLLQLPSGELVGESLAIMEYLEDIAESQNMPPLRGNTPLERAKVRTLLSLIETVTLAVEIAAVNGSVAFASLVDNQQSPGLERWLLSFIQKNLARIEEVAHPEGAYLIDGGVTMPDCALFATLQYAEELWGLYLVKDLPKLRRFLGEFGKRKSAEVPVGTWADEMTVVTREFIKF